MEFGGTGSTERDRTMMGSFESVAGDGPEKSKDKSEKKKSKTKYRTVELENEKAHETKGKLAGSSESGEKRESRKTQEVAEADVEKLTGEKKQVGAKEYVERRLEEVEEEAAQASEGSQEESAAMVDGALLEAIKRQIEQGEQVDNEMLDAALATTAETLDIESVGQSHNTEINEEKVAVADDTPDTEQIANQQANTSIEETPQKKDATSDSSSNPRPAPSLPTAAPFQASGLRAAPQHPSAPVGGAGGGWRPPVGSDTFPLSGDNNPNAVPLNIESDADSEPNTYRRRTRGADLLAGGLIGYLIGRRRGRLKTETRLLPVKKELEKHVADLQEKINIRERKIRHLATEHITIPSIRQEAFISGQSLDRANEVQEIGASGSTQETAGETAGAKPEKLVRFVMPKQSTELETRTDIAVVPEIQKLHLEALPEEDEAETTRLPRTPEIQTKEVEVMTKDELLGTAGKIEVNGTSLKHIFEAGQIDERGLREAVKEHRRGNSVERLLAERRKAEVSPERLGNVNFQHGSSSGTASGSIAPRSAINASGPERTTYKNSEQLMPVFQDTTQTESRHKQARIMAMVTAAILIGLALLLLFL